jgi:membrane protease YdiL (CAAX protease family)
MHERPEDPENKSPGFPVDVRLTEAISPPLVNRVWELGVWLVLTALVSLIFLLHFLAPAPAAEDNEDPTGGLEFRIQARYVLGAAALTEGLGNNDVLSTPLLAQLRQTVKNPAAGVCVVPVIAEIAGFDAALEEIARLRLQEDLAESDTADLALLEQLYTRSPKALDLEAQLAFTDRRDWFAQLALSHVEGADTGEHDLILATAKRTASVLLALGGGVATAAFAGLALLALGGLLWQQGSLRSGYVLSSHVLSSHVLSPHSDAATNRIPYLETLVVFIIATLSFGLLGGLLQEALGLGTSAALTVSMLSLLAVFWPRVQGVGADELRRACGWHLGSGFWREVGSGLLGYVAGAPVLLAALGVSVLLSKWLDTQASHPITEEIAKANWATLTLIFILAAVWAPLVEESIFRGGFYHYLRGRLGIVAAALMTSFLFAVIHPQGLVGVPPLMALAMILALIREWRGSLVGSITVHAVHNGMTITLVYFMLG